MPLNRLSVYHARNIEELSLNFHPIYNIIHGLNGSGKTTILECIHTLLRAKTFRTNKFSSFISTQSNECIVHSVFTDTNSDNDFILGIKRSINTNSNPVIHLNSKKIFSLSSISKLAILGLITPDSFNLIDAGPSIRRKYIDWGLFHVEHGFLKIWKDYNSVLQNRNTLLKSLSRQNKKSMSSELINEIKIWDKQLTLLNLKINHYRQNQFNLVKPIFYEIVTFFSESLANDISLNYYQGWNEHSDFTHLLKTKFSDDIRNGFTNFGTHRSDINFLIHNKPAKDILSRGQKKILVLSLILAQFIFLIINKELLTTDSRHFLLLLDDIDSELDEKNLRRLFDYLSRFKEIQYFITTTNEQRFKFIEDYKLKMFHVEHGALLKLKG